MTECVFIDRANMSIRKVFVWWLDIVDCDFVINSMCAGFV